MDACASLRTFVSPFIGNYVSKKHTTPPSDDFTEGVVEPESAATNVTQTAPTSQATGT